MAQSLSLFSNPAHDLTLEQAIAQSIAVLGQSGSGKSMTALRLFEQLLNAGVPGVVIDVADEHWGLEERYQIVIAGKSAHARIEITDPAQASALAVWSLQTGTSVILSLRNYRFEMRAAIVQAYFEGLWEEAGKLRRPYKILMEEAHNWIPQDGKAVTTDILLTIATEGRKDGLTFIYVDQRPARIDKTALTQASTVLIHRLWLSNDLDPFKDTFGRQKDVRDQVVKLDKGEALLATQSQVQLVRVLERETYHGGYTPGLDTHVLTPTFTSVSDESLAALAQLLEAAKGKEKPDTALARLQTKVEEQSALLQQKDEEIARLIQERDELQRLNTTLSQFKIEMAVPDALNVGMMRVEQVNGHLAPMPLVEGADGPLPGSSLRTIETQASMPASLTVSQNDKEWRSPIALERAIRKQTREFEAFLRDAQSASILHLTLFTYLASRSNQSFSRKELARATRYQEKTLTDSPPMFFMRHQLIQRDRIGGIYYYSAPRVEQVLHEKFPDLDQDVLYREFLAGCAV